MLHKEKRLSTRDVSHAFESSRKTVSSGGFRVTIAKIPEFTQTKYACIVSKKIAPTAVIRNKLRRWCYQSIEKYPIPSKLSHGILVYCQKEALLFTRQEFHEALQKLLQKIV